MFWQCRPSSNNVVPSNTNMHELATTREEGLHFILSDSENYNFDIKFECYGLMSFLKAVIDCGCLRFWCGKAKSVFCFWIKEKEKDKFYIDFYCTIFLQSCFFIAHYLNWIIIMNMCMKFIIIASYNELITNKVI